MVIGRLAFFFIHFIIILAEDDKIAILGRVTVPMTMPAARTTLPCGSRRMSAVAARRLRARRERGEGFGLAGGSQVGGHARTSAGWLG